MRLNCQKSKVQLFPDKLRWLRFLVCVAQTSGSVFRHKSQRILCITCMLTAFTGVKHSYFDHTNWYLTNLAVINV